MKDKDQRIKELEQQLEAKNQELKAQRREAKKANTRAKNAEAKAKELSDELKAEKKENRKKTMDGSASGSARLDLRHIKGHSFPELVVKLCTTFQARTCMGLGTIKAVLEIVFEILGIDLKLPVRQTISNWTEKCGAAVYCAAGMDLCQKY